MSTSGTTLFAMDFTEIAEEAWENAGKEMRSGYDLRTARRSMNLMTIDWQNRGINMWTIDEGTITLEANKATYDLPSDTIDLMEQVIRTGEGTAQQADINISRISVSTYSTIPNKANTGRPIQVWVQRLRDAPKITVWPVPDQDNTYVFKYWRLRRIQDAGDGAESPDVQFRFLPALTTGLAYYLALKSPDLMPRVQMLKQIYDEAFDNAAGEDREKAPDRFIPRQQYIG